MSNFVLEVKSFYFLLEHFVGVFVTCRIFYAFTYSLAVKCLLY